MNKRGFAILVVSFLLGLAALACAADPAPTDTPTPVPTDAPTPAVEGPPGAYDGVWVGTTSQDYPITVTVKDSVVTSVEFGVMLTGVGWSAESDQYRPAAAAVTDGQFRVSVEYDTWSVDVAGEFAEDALQGALGVAHYHPQGLGTAQAMVVFNAVRQPEPEQGEGA